LCRALAVCIRGRGDEIRRLMHLMKTWTPWL
jgi:hypothetical protein